MQKKSFYGSDEKELLTEFIQFMNQVFFKAPGIKLVGHNIKGFDLPYIINILNTQPYISQEQQDKLRLFNEKIKMKQLLLLKIVVVFFIILGGVIIYFIFH